MSADLVKRTGRLLAHVVQHRGPADADVFSEMLMRGDNQPFLVALVEPFAFAMAPTVIRCKPGTLTHGAICASPPLRPLWC